MVRFRSQNIGRVSGFKTVTDTKRGFWGSPKNYHSIDQDWVYPGVPEWSSMRYPINRGDHSSPTDYYRDGWSTLADEPYVYNTKGSDGNGAWSDTRANHMSRYLIAMGPEDPPNIASFRDNAINASVTTALNRLRENKAGWGANVLQGVQTAHMLAAPVRLVLEARKAARNGDWRRVRRLLGPPQRWWNGKRLSDGWLQYIYGWLPLYSDIHSSYNILRSACKPGHMLINASSKKEERYGSSRLDSSGQFRDTWDVTVQTRCKLVASLESDTWAYLDEMGLANPLEIAWDVVPFSFVIDWFIPVGNILSSLSAGLGLSFRSGFQTTITQFTKQTSAVSSGIWGATLVSPGNLLVGAKSFQRKAYYGFPMPALYGVRNPFSTPHILNAVALIRQLT